LPKIALNLGNWKIGHLIWNRDFFFGTFVETLK
jgi:hypothetical protein